MDVRALILQVMVALETMAILLLALKTTALGHGIGRMISLKLAGIAVTFFVIARFATHLQSLFHTVVDRTTHWRVHWLVLLVLLICAARQGVCFDSCIQWRRTLNKFISLSLRTAAGDLQIVSMALLGESQDNGAQKGTLTFVRGIGRLIGITGKSDFIGVAVTSTTKEAIPMLMS